MINQYAGKRVRMFGFAPLPDVAKCDTCGNKAIYQFHRHGACSKHKDSLRALCLQEERKHSQYDPVKAETIVKRQFKASHYKRNRKLVKL